MIIVLESIIHNALVVKQNEYHMAQNNQHALTAREAYNFDKIKRESLHIITQTTPSTFTASMFTKNNVSLKSLAMQTSHVCSLKASHLVCKPFFLSHT